MFYGMMRVKNEQRWIEKSLRPLLEVCELVFLFDDHSTDATVEIAKGLGTETEGLVVIPSPFTGVDESRDKTFLLSRITKIIPTRDINEHSPHWVICIDGDEELMVEDLDRLMVNTSNLEVSYSFKILTLYDSLKLVRKDAPYDNLVRPSMFRLIRPNMVFKSNGGHGGGFHCSNVPADIGYGVKVHDPGGPVKLKHYGYLDMATRERKFKFYMEHDPKHEDWYRKECFGPATVELL